MKLGKQKKYRVLNRKTTISSKQIYNAIAYTLSVVLLLVAVPMLMNQSTSADGCSHTHDSICGFAAASPCTYLHEHSDDCGFDAEEGSPCEDVHTHDPGCGYADPAPCTYVCIEVFDRPGTDDDDDLIESDDVNDDENVENENDTGDDNFFDEEDDSEKNNDDNSDNEDTPDLDDQ